MDTIAEWVRLTDEKAKGAQVGHPGGKQPHDAGVSKAAREIGVSRQQAQRAAKVDGLSDDAKAAAREVGLADNQSALLRAAQRPTAERAEAIRNYGPAPPCLPASTYNEINRLATTSLIIKEPLTLHSKPISLIGVLRGSRTPLGQLIALRLSCQCIERMIALRSQAGQVAFCMTCLETMGVMEITKCEVWGILERGQIIDEPYVNSSNKWSARIAQRLPGRCDLAILEVTFWNDMLIVTDIIRKE